MVVAALPRCFVDMTVSTESGTIYKSLYYHVSSTYRYWQLYKGSSNYFRSSPALLRCFLHRDFTSRAFGIYWIPYHMVKFLPQNGGWICGKIIHIEFSVCEPVPHGKFDKTRSKFCVVLIIGMNSILRCTSAVQLSNLLSSVWKSLWL